MTKFGLFTTILLALVTAAGCGAQHRVNLSAEEAAIRRMDAVWLAAAAAHGDLEKAPDGAWKCVLDVMSPAASPKMK